MSLRRKIIPRMLPGNLKQQLIMELPAHISLVALSQPWLTEGHVSELEAQLVLWQALDPQASVTPALQALAQLREAIQAEAERPPMDPEVLAGIREAVVMALLVVRSTGNLKLQAAIAALTRAPRG